MEKYGKIINNLDKVRLSRGMSKNKLSHRAEMEKTQLNKWLNNQITRIDTDVLARLCTALDCRVEDILQFIPPEEEF